MTRCFERGASRPWRSGRFLYLGLRCGGALCSCALLGIKNRPRSTRLSCRPIEIGDLAAIAQGFGFRWPQAAVLQSGRLLMSWKFRHKVLPQCSDRCVAGVEDEQSLKSFEQSRREFFDRRLRFGRRRLNRPSARSGQINFTQRGLRRCQFCQPGFQLLLEPGALRNAGRASQISLRLLHCGDGSQPFSLGRLLGHCCPSRIYFAAFVNNLCVTSSPKRRLSANQIGTWNLKHQLARLPKRLFQWTPEGAVRKWRKVDSTPMALNRYSLSLASSRSNLSCDEPRQPSRSVAVFRSIAITVSRSRTE